MEKRSIDENKLKYLELLSKSFKNRVSTAAEIINLSAILSLPKETEYFFSDIHGEYESFTYLLHSASGMIKNRIKLRFKDELNDAEQEALARIIYYPEEELSKSGLTDEFYKDTIMRLISLARLVNTKYTRSKVRKMMPDAYSYILEELLYEVEGDDKRKLYHDEIIENIFQLGEAKSFIIIVVDLIRKLAIGTLHIIGDVFDRGPRSDYVIDELMKFDDIDFEWGNHDIEWMGAACGNEALICNCLRIAVRYNNFDLLEDGYGINIRPLSMFAEQIYRSDPCELFVPQIYDENKYDKVDKLLAAKMQKALYILQVKLEGNLIKSHPEYQMEDRLVFDKVDFDNWTYTYNGTTYKMEDTNFPTVDKNDPYKLTEEEEKLIYTLKHSFLNSEKLQKHIDFIYSCGSLYKIYNGNLMYHGCIPLNEDGSFLAHNPKGDTRFLSGRKLMDYFQDRIYEARYARYDMTRYKRALDRMWYLWCGPKSPVFGKDCMKTFEIYFIKTENKELYKEVSNAYYELSKQESIAKMILREFELDENKGHIINGHVPVKKGESPIRANGRLFVIDGGISKGYRKKTGIAGYTLISDSLHLTLATHMPYEKGVSDSPETTAVEEVDSRILVNEVDKGLELRSQIENLKDLLYAYDVGLIKES